MFIFTLKEIFPVLLALSSIIVFYEKQGIMVLLYQKQVLEKENMCPKDELDIFLKCFYVL